MSCTCIRHSKDDALLAECAQCRCARDKKFARRCQLPADCKTWMRGSDGVVGITRRFIHPIRKTK